MASVTASGLGSGIDISGIVEQLVAAERAPTANRLDLKEANFQTELSALGALKGALSTFQTAFAKLSDLSAFQKYNVSSGDSTVVLASGSSTAAPGSYDVETTTLAKAQTLASKAFTNTTDAVGEGTLTFRFGTYASGPNTFTANPDKGIETVTIGAGNNSLLGIRDAVNAADIGVTATIINDGTGNRLVFNSGSSGAANSLEITVSDLTDASDIDDAGLSQLAYDPTAVGLGSGKNLTEKTVATDAAFKVNGLDITRSSNLVSDVISGVTLTLKDTNSGTPVKVEVSQDEGNVTSQVSSFVSSYNDLFKTIDSISGVDEDTSLASILTGDSLVRTISAKTKNIISSTIEGLSGSYTSLSEIGITTSTDGTLKLDSTVLQKAVDADFNIVGRIFSASGDPSDSLINFNESGDDTEVGDYAVNITTIATQGDFVGGVAALTVDATNDTFSITVDGVASSTVTLTQAVYATGADLAAQLQSRINADSNLKDAGVSVVVSYDTDHFVVTSARYGSASNVSFGTVEGTGLGLDAGTATDGVDVAGSIGGSTATGSGQTLTGAGAADGLKIDVIGGVTGARGTVNFTRGIADQLDTLFSSYLGTDNVIDDRTEGINDSIDDINSQREALNRRMASLEARLLQQYIAMDALVGQLQSTSSFLSQQLSNLPGAIKAKSS